MRAELRNRMIISRTTDAGVHLSRQDLIRAGKLWQVYNCNDVGQVEDTIIEFDSRAKALAYVIKNYGQKYWENGISFGKLIWEKEGAT